MATAPTSGKVAAQFYFACELWQVQWDKCTVRIDAISRARLRSMISEQGSGTSSNTNSSSEIDTRDESAMH